MKFASISDIHIHNEGDTGWKCFAAFSKHQSVIQATHIGLLGDIFDLMAGDHPEYLQRHQTFFQTLKDWCEQGKTVFFAEGNHDMHLGKLLRRVTQTWSPSAAARLVLLREDRLINIDGKTFYIGHGDKYNQDDTTYLSWMKFIGKKPWAFVANHVMPYGVLNSLGERASKKSRAHGYRLFDENDVKEKFRRGLQQLVPPQAEVVVGGHSHVPDEFHWDQKVYVNNGFPAKSGKFVVVDEHGPRLIDLQSSLV